MVRFTKSVIAYIYVTLWQVKCLNLDLSCMMFRFTKTVSHNSDMSHYGHITISNQVITAILTTLWPGL